MTDKPKAKPRGKMVDCNCDFCGKPFVARQADRDRGWARFCGKPCKDRAGAKKVTGAPILPLGRPAFNWTPEIEEEIFERMAMGESVRSISSDSHMPAAITIRKRVIDDADFSAKYARARMMQADHWVDEIPEIADTTMIGEKIKTSPDGVEITKADMIEHRKLRIDSRKWVASKLAPKVYGDKLDLNVDGELNISAVPDRLARAKQRLMDGAE